MLNILNNIPFELDEVDLMLQAGVEMDSETFSEFNEIFDYAVKNAKPKAIYKECFIDRKGEDTVTVEGIKFTSLALRKNLDEVQRVFPFICTCGQEINEAFSGEKDAVKSFYMDKIKTALLWEAVKHLNEHLEKKYLLGKTADMKPGSGDADLWPIQQQKELFSLLGDVKEAIGVELTESFHMNPSKTVSGILFQSEKGFVTCQVCHRKICRNRTAEFDKDLWKSLQNT